MSRGKNGGKSITTRMDALTWLSIVKVGNEGRRESSSGGRDGHASAVGSAASSRIGSRSRPHSGPETSVGRRRSSSRTNGAGTGTRTGTEDSVVVGGRKDTDVIPHAGQSLQDE
jgi:hypothetical protein